jgi:hypothetical protein
VLIISREVRARRAKQRALCFFILTPSITFTSFGSYNLCNDVHLKRLMAEVCWFVLSFCGNFVL